jgi:hypothetical protein
MSDLFDCRISVGPYTLDIIFFYEGKVVTDSTGNMDESNVNLECINVETFKGEDWIFSDTFNSINELNLSPRQAELLERAEQTAYDNYVNNDSNWITDGEYYSDQYTLEER